MKKETSSGVSLTSVLLSDTKIGQVFSILFIIISGLFYAYLTVGPRVLNPSNINWLIGDPATGYLGWLFFRHEARLALPFGWSHALGYPLGETIAYLDSVPLVASFFWFFNNYLPVNFQYHGIYFAVCCILQYFFGFLICRRIANGNSAVGLIGGLFFLTAPSFTARAFGHFALASHWIILAALNCFLAHWNRVSIKRISYMTGLCLVAGGINPYITFMVLILVSGTYVVALIQSDADRVQSIARQRCYAIGGGIVAVGASVFSLMMFGFLRPGEASQYAGFGYGVFSMNLLAPIDPGATGSILLKAQPSNAGQNEGFNYLGCGAILLLFSALLRRPDVAFKICNYRALVGCVIIIGTMLLALSLKATVGHWVLYNIPVPDWILTGLSAFRATGRLFWPGYYLILACIIMVGCYAFGRAFPAVLSVFLLLQLADISLLTTVIRGQWTASQAATLSDDPAWRELGKVHRHLIVVPPWQCAAELGPGGHDGWWLFGKLAGDQRMTVNSFYAGRNSPAQLEYFCDEQDKDIQRNGLRADSAYVFSVDRTAMLTAIPHNMHRCRYLDETILCTESEENPGLDPALALSLPLLPLNEPVGFGKGEAVSSRMTAAGWSFPEDWGRWMLGPEASLAFRLTSSQPVAVHLSVTPYLPFEQSSQRLIAKVGGRLLGSWKFTQKEQDDVAFILHPEDANRNQVVVLRFEMPDAVSPSELGLSGDERKVGVGMVELRAWPAQVQ